MSDALVGTVVKLQGNTFVVASAGRRYGCSVRGRMKQDRQHSVRLIAVGDEVEFQADADGSGVVEAVRPRRNKIARPSVRQHGKEQVIVANIDQFLAVQSVHAPELQLETLDRCLVIGELFGIAQCRILITKCDLAAAGELDQVRALYQATGYPVLFTSASDQQGIAELRDCLKDRSTVLLGPSGAGKSSLVNVLVPDAHVAVGAISAYTEEGCHTTTWIEMLPLPEGGFLIDTPGMDVFGLWNVERADLAAFFPEMLALAGQCRFSDCRHLHEPGCIIRDRIAPSRYESYRKMFEEIPVSRYE